jgi:hypothetical protein
MTPLYLPQPIFSLVPLRHRFLPLFVEILSNHIQDARKMELRSGLRSFRLQKLHGYLAVKGFLLPWVTESLVSFTVAVLLGLLISIFRPTLPKLFLQLPSMMPYSGYGKNTQ